MSILSNTHSAQARHTRARAHTRIHRHTPCLEQVVCRAGELVAGQTARLPCAAESLKLKSPEVSELISVLGSQPGKQEGGKQRHAKTSWNQLRWGQAALTYRAPRPRRAKWTVLLHRQHKALETWWWSSCLLLSVRQHRLQMCMAGSFA